MFVCGKRDHGCLGKLLLVVVISFPSGVISQWLIGGFGVVWIPGIPLLLGVPRFESICWTFFYSRKANSCPLKINGWKMYFLLKSSLFWGHDGHISFRVQLENMQCLTILQFSFDRHKLQCSLFVPLLEPKMDP